MTNFLRSEVIDAIFFISEGQTLIEKLRSYWVPQKLPQIYTVIAYICIEKVAWFEVYIYGNLWNT